MAIESEGDTHTHIRAASENVNEKKYNENLSREKKMYHVKD